MLLIWALHLISLSAAQDIENLSSYNIDKTQTTISGFSSGAMLSMQMHVAMSKDIKGAGMFAPYPYGCTQGLGSLIEQCSNGTLIDLDVLEAQAEELEDEDRIDSLENIQNSKVYVQGSASDDVIFLEASQKTAELYERFGADIKTEFALDTGHMLPTVDAINYNGAQIVLEHLLGDLKDGVDAKAENFHYIDQSDFFADGTSMDDIAVVYVPSTCAAGDGCILHIHLHPCGGGIQWQGTTYYTTSGFNEVAEANNIIVLYPQVVSQSPENPLACYDMWGYNSNSDEPLNYITKEGKQIKGIWKMVKRIYNEDAEEADEDDDDDHCNIGIKLIPLFFLIVLIVAAVLFSICAMQRKNSTEKPQIPPTEGDAQPVPQLEPKEEKTYQIQEEAPPKRFADLHLLTRWLDASGKDGVARIATLFAVVLLQFLVIGIILIPWELKEKEIEGLHVVPLLIAMIIATVASVGMVSAGDKWQISLIVNIASLIGIVILMAFSCTSIWPLGWLVTSVGRIAVVESIIALIRLKRLK